MSGEERRSTASYSTRSTVALSGFGLSVLDAAAPADDWKPELTVERAIRHYLDDRKLRPPGWACLPLPEVDDDPGSSGAPVEIELDDDAVRTVSEEAEAQGVSVEALVTHAVMYLWAAEHPSPPGSGQAEDRPRHPTGPDVGAVRRPASRRASKASHGG